MALVQSGRKSTVDALKLIEILSENEEDYSVWQSLSSALDKMLILTSNTEYHDLFKQFGQKVLAKILFKI